MLYFTNSYKISKSKTSCWYYKHAVDDTWLASMVIYTRSDGMAFISDRLIGGCLPAHKCSSFEEGNEYLVSGLIKLGYKLISPKLEILL
jgi:hypothetical protein